MRRAKTADNQLPIEWMDTMRWDDVPAPLRDRVREQLAELLRQAAGAAADGEVSHDDE
jgi:hypothetical protein